MRNYEKLAYTYRHRRALEYLACKLIQDPADREEMLHRISIHDMDKMVMLLVMDKSEASRIHRATAPHHIENDIPKTRYDYMEAILDYESAGYTKPDKPLNAYDTVFQLKSYDSNANDCLLVVMEELGIASSYSVTDDVEGMQYMSQYSCVSEDMIADEISDYLGYLLES